MKKIVLLSIFSVAIILSWCDNSHNFMDVDNENAKEDLKSLIKSKEIDIPSLNVNVEDILPESLSWTWQDAKWYVNKYIDDSMQPYVDKAKEWINWVKESLKWYYNDWVDELNWLISEKVNSAISWELSKFKIN